MCALHFENKINDFSLILLWRCLFVGDVLYRAKLVPMCVSFTLLVIRGVPSLIFAQTQVSAPLNSRPVDGYRKGRATPICTWSPAQSGSWDMLHEVYFSACVSKTYRLVKLVETDSRSLCMLSFYIAFCHMQYWKLGEESVWEQG